MEIGFVKMRFAGEDYILVDAIREPLCDTRPQELAVQVLNRTRSVGAAALVVVMRGRHLPLAIDTYDSEGTRRRLSGGELGCTAVYAYTTGLIRSREVLIEAQADIYFVKLGEARDGGFRTSVVLGHAKMYAVTCHEKSLVHVSLAGEYLVAFGETEEARAALKEMLMHMGLKEQKVTCVTAEQGMSNSLVVQSWRGEQPAETTPIACAAAASAAVFLSDCSFEIPVCVMMSESKLSVHALQEKTVFIEEISYFICKGILYLTDDKTW